VILGGGVFLVKDSLIGYFNGNRQAIEESFTSEKLGVLESAASLIVECLRSGNKVLLCGNGGSAADCQHVAAELVGRFRKERKGYPAIALTTDSSVLTAWSNDYHFETVFSRQIESLGN